MHSDFHLIGLIGVLALVAVGLMAGAPGQKSAAQTTGDTAKSAADRVNDTAKTTTKDENLGKPKA